MYEIRLLADCPTSQWTGGTTTELYLDPPDGSYAERNFDLRLSTATIEQSPTQFTLLPAFRRHLMTLDRPLMIGHPEHGQCLWLNRFKMHVFNGDEPTISTGRCRDFNVIYRAGLTVETFVYGPRDVFVLQKGDLLFNPYAADLALPNETLHLEQSSLLRWQDRAVEVHQVTDPLIYPLVVVRRSYGINDPHNA